MLFNNDTLNIIADSIIQHHKKGSKTQSNMNILESKRSVLIKPLQPLILALGQEIQIEKTEIQLKPLEIQISQLDFNI